MKYYVEISGPEELDVFWEDPNAPHMGFALLEREEEELTLDNEGRIFASYETFEVAEGETFSWRCIGPDGTVEVHTIGPGEYGLRTAEMEKTSPSLPEAMFTP